jgi:hypothetical protein
MIPTSVIDIRRELCPTCAPHAHDPCAACSHGLWGPYVYCPPEEPPLPPLAARARNLAAQSIEEMAAIATGVPPVPTEEAERRIAICRSNECGAWRSSDETCSVCGCPMARKAPWRSARCPRAKW